MKAKGHDRSPPLAEHQLTVIRVFLRQRFPGAELIDRLDVEVAAHRFTLDPGRASKRTLLVPRALREAPSSRRCSPRPWSWP